MRRGLAAVAAIAVLFVLIRAPSTLAVEVQRVDAGSVEAWLVEDPSVPVISVHIAFRGGAALDPAGKEGLANMAMALLDEGAGDLDSEAFQDRLEELAVELGFGAEPDLVTASLRTLAEHRDAAFELLKTALARPRFDAEPVSRIRGQLEARLRRQAGDADVQARQRFFETMFPNHPYARPVEGTEASLAAITVDDLRAFALSRLARDTIVIGVVGDVTAAELRPLLADLAAALPATAAEDGVAAVAPAATGATIVVDRPGPQSEVMFGHAGLRRDDPDFYAATVLNQVLGAGGLTSRLFLEVRERRGLTYGVHTSLYPLRHAALIVGQAATANERVAETVAVIRTEWRRMAETGIGEDEFADAKTYLTGSFPLRFTQSGRIAAMLVGMQLHDLGIDYIDRRNGLIEAVTLADVNRLARRLLDPEALTFVVVGQPEGLTATN